MARLRRVPADCLPTYVTARTATVMSLMGWSSDSTAARYQHVTDDLRIEVAGQVGDLIWQSNSAPVTVEWVP